MRKAFLVALVSALLVYVPVAPAASAIAVGQATVKGMAEVNGLTAPPQFTIFSGDRVVTQSKTAAQLALPGGNEVLLPSLSDATVTQAAQKFYVSLNRGALAILSKANDPVIVEAAGARIHAAAGVAAVLEVSVNGNEVRVYSRRGTATVESANKTVEVPAGKELVANMAKPPQPDNNAGGLSGMDKALLVTGVGSGLTGLALGAVALSRPNPNSCTVVSNGTLSC
jgi:ferric-dicitrate binding protein FerR (iron transport regulator)